MRAAILTLTTASAFFFLAQTVLSGTAADWNRKGNQAFRSENYAEAVVFYSNALQEDQRCYQALYNRGLANYRLQRLDEAWNDLSKLLEVDPESDKGSNLLGLIELKRGRYDSAFGRFRRASQLKEESKYFFNAGLAAYKAGFCDVAKKYGREALIVDPKNKHALKLITVCRRREERIAERRAELLAYQEARDREARRLYRARMSSKSRPTRTLKRCSLKKPKRRARRKG